MANFTIGVISEEEDRKLVRDFSTIEEAPQQEEASASPSFSITPISEEEDRPLYHREKVTKQEPDRKEEPLSISPVDVMFDNPEKLLEFEAAREAKEKQLQSMDWSGEFTQEYEQEYGTTREDYLSTKQIAASPKAIEMMQRYLKPRIGKEAVEYSEPEELVQRFLEHSRWIGSNAASMSEEIGILMESKDDQQAMSDAAMMYLMYENMLPAGANAEDNKFGEFIGALGDHALAMVTDPINIATLGSGYLVNQGVKSTGQKLLGEALRANLPRLLSSQAIEGTLVAWDNANRQQAKIQTGLQEDFSYSEMGLNVLMNGAIVGATDLTAALKAAKGLNAKEALDKKLGIDPRERRLREEANEQARIANYDPEIGKKVREDLQRGTLWENLNTADPTVVEPELRVHIQKNLAEALTDWASNNPTVADRLRSTARDNRITDVVYDMISKGEVEAAGDLSDALSRAGVTNAQFAHAFRGSVADAASTLGSWGAFKRKLDGIADASPELAKALEEMGSGTTTIIQDFWSVAQKSDRGIRSLLVTAPVTTMRNIIGNSAHMAIDTFTDMADNVIWNIAYRKANGQGAGAAAWEGMKQSVNVVSRLYKQAEQDEVLKRVLKNHSNIENRLMHYVQDGAANQGDGVLSKAIDSLQFFNRAQDQFFRKAIFNNRVDHYLRRQKLGTLNDYLKDSKPIPKEILIKSMEDSLDRTFSKQYNGSDAASGLIKHIEDMAPVSTYFIPFPRYTVNAMEFVYKHSPIGVADAVYSEGKRKLKGGADLTEEQLQAMSNQVVKSLTGTAAIYGFYKYAEANPDDEWNIITDDETGATKDVTTIGPIAIFKMLATVSFRLANDMPLNMTLADVNEAITGLNLTGASLEADAGEVLRAMVGGEEATQEQSRFMEKLGFVVGSHVGRAAQPIAWVSDLVAAIDTEEGVVRNRKVLSEEGGFAEAFGNTIKNRVPVLKQDLPPYVSATREGDMRRYDTLGTLVTGLRREPARGLAEIQLRKHGIEPWTIGPYKKDPAVRDMIVKEMQPFINVMLEEELLSTDRYVQASRAEQKGMLKNWMSEVVTPIATELSNAKANPEAVKRIQRESWRSLPTYVRKIVNERREKQGKPSIEDSGEYLQGAKEADYARSLM